MLLAKILVTGKFQSFDGIKPVIIVIPVIIGGYGKSIPQR